MKTISGLMLGTVLLRMAVSGEEADLREGISAEMLKPKGEYYAATVPDTLDLAERARLSVRGLTNFLNPVGPVHARLKNEQRNGHGETSPGWRMLNKGRIELR